MKKIVVFSVVFLLTATIVNAQKKKDLLEEIESLKQELRNTKGELADANKTIKVSEAKVKSMETQVKTLEETNTSLLSNMTNFTELSNKKAENLKKSQEIIKMKDNQLNTIVDALTKNDSLNLATYSKLKNALGGDAVKIGNGTIYVVMQNSTLFGSDKDHDVKADAKTALSNVAQVLNANPNLSIIVEGNSNALKFDGKSKDNWDLSSRQAAAVVSVLQNEFEVPPKRMEVLGRGEHGSQAIETVTRIIIDPGFDTFYSMVKENMKNAAKK